MKQEAYTKADPICNTTVGRYNTFCKYVYENLKTPNTQKPMF